MSDLGPVAHYLEVRVIREEAPWGSYSTYLCKIKLTQRVHVEKVL